MVDPTATWALETLRGLLIKEVKFLSDVEGQVEDLGRNLQRMHDFLKDADKWPDRYDSAIVRRRVSDLINLATSVEDIVEKYAVEVASKRGAINLKKWLKRFICILCGCLGLQTLHEIGKETAGIMSRLAELTKNLESISNGEGSSNFRCNDDEQLLRQTYGHGNEKHFVGMKKDIDILVLRMKNDDRSSRVISICGMGGLGKTTLARKIYQHKFGFEAHAWVCIRQKLQAKAILQEILRQLLRGANNQCVTRMEEAELVRELYDIQQAKKCLVVIDDIWEIDHWNILERAFPLEESKSKSKILLTTRNQRIADTAGFAHKLGLLTEDESLDLLQKIALPIHQSEATTKQFEATGRLLVRKCGRLPLAVSVIGGILGGQQNLGDWNKVLENMDVCLKHGKGVDANDKRIKQVLNLSYNLLPYYLKLCFLYLGCFQEDEDIELEGVYLIWMAEGLVSSDDKGRNETLRDVAERYLNELASKCMVQVQMSTKGFKSCRLHDLVRNLCLSKGKEEKFFEDSEGKIQRLAFNLGDDDGCSNAQFKNANLRSLLLLSKYAYRDRTNILQNLFSNAFLRYLKVLVLENCTFEDKKLPHAVTKLVMLKHLSIRRSIVEEVPEFVCKLPFLLSLDLRAGIKITLPSSIENMGRLRHLFFDLEQTKTIDGGRLRLDGLTELETLIGFSSEVFDTNHVLKLTNLRRFGGLVHDIESLFVVVDHIINLKDQLREASLKIYAMDLTSERGSLVIDSLMHCPLNDLTIYGKFRRLPTWDPQLLQNLVSLSLDGCQIVVDPMETLQHLLTLQRLFLGHDAFVGTEMVCKSKGFPQLKSLSLRALTNLVGWTVEKEAMPNLSRLFIFACPKLEMIPQGIIFMASLTKLVIEFMPSNFVERLRRGGEDYHKISHIPFIEGPFGTDP